MRNCYMNKERLINEVYQRPPLWDKRLRDRRDRTVVDALWREVGEACEVEVSEAKKLWKNLVDHFRNILKAILQKRTGDGFEDVEEAANLVKWSHFKQLMFLKDVVGTRRTSSILDIQPEPLVVSIIPEFQTKQEPLEAAESFPSMSTRLSTEHSESPSPHPSECSTSVPKIHQKNKKRAPSERIRELESELTNKNREVKKDDKVRRFADHLADIVREVPEPFQRQCMFELIKVANSFVDSLSVQTLDIESSDGSTILG